MNSHRPVAITPDEEARASFRLAESTAWEQYRVARLHVTHDDADAWFARIESGELVPVPEGHD